jgi:mono/diheme cytochrome c family protein
MGKYMKIKTSTFTVSISLLLVLTCSDIHAHSWEAPQIEAQEKNPIPLNAGSIKSGKVIFTELCSTCHGDNAEGLKSEESGLEKNTENLRKRLKGHSDGDFFWKIQNGKGERPSFSKELAEMQIWNVINYIKSIDNQGAK